MTSTQASGAVPHSNSSINVAAALQSNTLGVCFSGSGFLIFYFTGVTAILKSLGIITSSTKVAGSSGGAANAAATCAGTPPQQQYASLLDMATSCRPTGSCRGFLDTAVAKNLGLLLPADAAQRCSGRLFVGVTLAKPDNRPDPHLLLGGTWASRDALLHAVRSSCYIPGVSGQSVTTRISQVSDAVYDGGFSNMIPCPPGVGASVAVSAYAPVPGTDPAKDAVALLDRVNAALRDSKDKNTAPFLPLNPEAMPPPPVDIFPGLSGPLLVSPKTWNSWMLSIPSNQTLLYVYDVGRRDAAYWATSKGLTSEAQVMQALAETSVCA